MVNWDHGNLEAAALDSSTELRDNAPTQDDGRSKGEAGDISFCTQAVPPHEPKAFLRFLEEEQPSERNIRLQLPTAPDSETLINVGR